jgi:hypothetical protein
VHSRDSSDVQRGIELAEALTDSPGLEQRDLLYLVAVRSLAGKVQCSTRVVHLQLCLTLASSKIGAPVPFLMLSMHLYS